MLHRHRRWSLLAAASFAAALAASGCLKSLDESLLDTLDADAGTGGTTTGGAGGSAGQAGAGGAPGGTGGADASAGTGGTAGTGDSGSDAEPDAGFIPYDPTAHPVTDVGNEMIQPLVIGVDNENVYRAQRLAPDTTVVARSIMTGSGVPLSGGIKKPADIIAPAISQFVFVAGGFQVGDQGQLFRMLKTGGNLGSITDAPDGGAPAIGRVVGLAEGPDNQVYFTARAPTAPAPHVLRVGMTPADTVAEVLYASESNNELGGDITVGASCVSWVSAGKVYVMRREGGTRHDALESPVSDVVGVTSDANNLYYTRGNGEVWQRGVDATCDGSGPPEVRIAAGFVNPADIIVYGSTVAWLAEGDSTNEFDGGGIFTTPIGGGVVEQIAPPDDGPDVLAHNSVYVVWATVNGLIRRVDK